MSIGEPPQYWATRYSPVLNEPKMKELIIYIAQQSKDDPNFDMQKLAALLYKIDMQNFLETGESLTGATYIKREDF